MDTPTAGLGRGQIELTLAFWEWLGPTWLYLSLSEYLSSGNQVQGGFENMKGGLFSIGRLSPGGEEFFLIFIQTNFNLDSPEMDNFRSYTYAYIAS